MTTPQKKSKRAAQRTWQSLDGFVHERMRPELVHEERPSRLWTPAHTPVKSSIRSSSHAPEDCRTTAGGTKEQGPPTLKCSSFPGGWLPTMKPHMAATPGSLKVVHSFDRLPAGRRTNTLIKLLYALAPRPPKLYSYPDRHFGKSRPLKQAHQRV